MTAKRRAPIKPGQRPMVEGDILAENLDPVDQSLLRLLQADSRASYASMASVVRLSPAAVRKRVNRLFEREVIRGIVVVDPMAMGVRDAALAGIRHRGELGDLEDSVKEIPEVMWAAITTGRYDMLVEIGASSNEHLLSVVNKIRSLDLVAEVEIMHLLRYVKFDAPAIQSVPDKAG